MQQPLIYAPLQARAAIVTGSWVWEASTPVVIADLASEPLRLATRECLEQGDTPIPVLMRPPTRRDFRSTIPTRCWSITIPGRHKKSVKQEKNIPTTKKTTPSSNAAPSSLCSVNASSLRTPVVLPLPQCSCPFTKRKGLGHTHGCRPSSGMKYWERLQFPDQVDFGHKPSPCVAIRLVTCLALSFPNQHLKHDWSPESFEI